MNAPVYSISILALDNLWLTRQCIESVLQHTNDYELILTNNGSTDGTKAYFEKLRQALPSVTVINNDTNLGYQEPNKKALGLARGQFFILLNNDVVVGPGWIDALVAPFSDPGVAATGPRGNCCSIHPNFHGFPGRLFEYLEGSCMMLRVDAVRHIGLFSPYLEMAYGEDSDMSLRLRYAGYKIARVACHIHHRQASTSKKVPGIRQYLHKNCETLKKVWHHYLIVRKVHHPIIVKRAAAIGDVLLTTALTRSLAEQRKTCTIYVETQFPDLFARNKDVKDAGHHIGMRPDAQVIDLNMAYENATNTSILDAYAQTAGIILNDRKLHFTPSNEALDWALNALPSGQPICVIAPGPTTWPGKNWSRHRFDFISHWMSSRGWSVVLVGGKGHPGIDSALDLRGTTTFDQSAAVMALSQLFIGLDSFPMHLAMSQSLPVVALFGTTLPQYILSEGVAIGVHADPAIVPCVGERHRSPGQTFVGCDGACMRAISVEMVQQAVNQLIGET